MYSKSFFDSQRAGSLRSARTCVPEIIDLLHPGSVVDVGCGTGAWLRAFIDAGISDVTGVDGSWAEASLVIPKSAFVAMNAPEHPTGWPSAIAPPLGLVFSMLKFRPLATASACAANASLDSITSMSSTDNPAFARAF